VAKNNKLKATPPVGHASKSSDWCNVAVAAYRYVVLKAIYKLSFN
jgi:hypothetical protein